MSLNSGEVLNKNIIFDSGVETDEIAFLNRAFSGLNSQNLVANTFSLAPGIWRITGARWTGAFMKSSGTTQDSIGLAFDFNFLIQDGNQLFGPSMSPSEPLPGAATAYRTVRNVVGKDPGEPIGNVVAEFAVEFEPITIFAEPPSVKRTFISILARGDFTYSPTDNNDGSEWRVAAGPSDLVGFGDYWKGGDNTGGEWTRLPGLAMDFSLFGYRVGDVDQNGVVNLLDVAPFVELLTMMTFQDEADINGDGEVSLLDVALFVDLLTQ